ncbi:ABC transporter substrate-binding protein [Roseomonas terrae]|jgi:peptide/nickel transport system substrate-binding protein|uniref:ABC transporter substrate-binding protein n=1 Tax=Neoroseomonas terrae TaxID=424799 RepID=A0ABS5EIF9_9PROT|nr:ABC transporter substrate-binding protein [Neoroseomonas terrae]MBR0650816.1 ABC transporter substrate-binding protein [Neoroseomonas terrae]
MNRRELLLAAGGLMSVPAASLSPAYGFEREGDRRIIVFSGNQPVPILDPHQRYDWSTRMMQRCLYDALVRYEGAPARIIPWLAESWDTSADGLTWTFRLVGNAKFNNGDVLDAEAVRFSFERGLKLNKGISWMLSRHLKPENIAAVDARTVRFTLDRPYPDFLSFLPLWFIVNPKQVTANAEGDDDGQKWLTANAAGSGPFRIRRWDGQSVMALEAVPDYWKGWPMPEPERPAGVIFRVMRESAPRKAALQRGEVDVASGLTPDDLSQLARMPNIVVSDNEGAAPFAIMMNTQKGPTADINLRKAIAYAFDYEALIAIHKGDAKLMDGPFPFVTEGRIQLDMPRKDLDRAKQFMARTPTPNGGLELEYLHVAGNEVQRQIGLVLLNALQPLGIRVNIVGQPWPTLVGRGGSPETAAAMTAVYVTPVTTSPDTVASQYASSAAGQFWGIHHLRDADIDRMVAEAAVELDEAKRLDLYAQIQRRVVDLQPVVFCMTANQRWAMRSYVRGFQHQALNLTGEMDLWSLYVARG